VPDEVEVGLAGGGEADLDLLEAHPTSSWNIAACAGVHRVDQRLVAVAQVDRAHLGRVRCDGSGQVRSGRSTSADAVVRQQGRARLTEALTGAPRGNGAGRAALVARLADGTSESAGESRTRWLLHVVGLPAPEPQAWIWGEGGFSARVDFLFRAERVVVEFDGLLKYGTVHDVTAEKLREDALRRLGYEVVRLTWADLAHPERVHARVLAAFARSAARGRAS
jgi:hypothetical protein